LIFLIPPNVDIVKIDHKEGKSNQGEDVKTNENGNIYEKEAERLHQAIATFGADKPHLDAGASGL
jgi:hypothetical protein